MLQSNRIFLSDIINKGMLKSWETRCNLKDSHCESEIVTINVIFAVLAKVITQWYVHTAIMFTRSQLNSQSCIDKLRGDFWLIWYNIKRAEAIILGRRCRYRHCL